MSTVVRLRPGLRPVRRAASEVQFGLSPGHGIVLAGLTEPESQLLLSLAATSGVSHGTVLAERFGVSPERVADLFTTLAQHGLLLDGGPSPDGGLVPDAGPAAGSGPDHHLAVPGRGSVIDRIRAGLAAVGAGALGVGDEELPEGDTTLAVLCAADAIAPDQGRAWQAAGVPQLPVVLREGEVVIGPLVRPGHSACLRCLDLHRSDRDRAWPSILTQLASPTHELARRVDAGPAVATTVAALVAMIALECLRGEDGVVGVSWHVSLPLPQVCTRVWTQHPACDCTLPGGSQSVGSQAVGSQSGGRQSGGGQSGGRPTAG